jgi:tRNA A-37 threonylcarbamoyl transferase component Bud32
MDPCLSEEAILELFDGRIEEDARATVERHMAACAACRTLVAHVARSASQAPAEASAAPGRTVGRYVLLRYLGSGASATVYAAYDPTLDRQVALKLLRVAGDEAAFAACQRRLSREARALGRLAHPNVVTVYDAGEVDGDVFIAMELVEGPTLREWLAEAPRSWREITRVFLAAGRGLAQAHALGIVHRDFKPENVLVGRDGRVRVTDFGLARLVEEAAEAAAGETAASAALLLTRLRGLVGTPAYMAPEQYRREPSDARTDIFSFCVALFEALTRDRPFAGETMEALREAVLEERVQEKPGARVPKRIRSLLLRGLRSDPALRPASMEEVLRELSRDPGRTARRALAVGALVLGFAGLAYLAAREDPRAACLGAERKLTGIWDTSRKRAARRAWGATGSPEAGWERVERALHAYSLAWVRVHNQACEATRVHGRESEETLGLKLDCLSQRLQDLSSLTGRLLQVEPRGLQRVVEDAEGLMDLRLCADVQTLRRRRQAECRFQQAAGGFCEMRFETLKIARQPFAGDRLAVVEVRGEPLVFAYESRAGRVALLNIDTDGSLLPRASVESPPGWTHFLAILVGGVPHIVGYDPARGELSLHRLEVTERLTQRFAAPSPPWTALVAIEVQGAPHLLAYRADTGLMRKYRVEVGGRLTALADSAWDRGLTTFMPFALRGDSRVLAYNGETGAASYLRWRENDFRPLAQRPWNPGWTSFVPFTVDGILHYVSYKSGTGQVLVDRFSEGDLSHTVWAAKRDPGFATILPFRLAGRPHFLAHDPGRGEVMVDRIDP